MLPFDASKSSFAFLTMSLVLPEPFFPAIKETISSIPENSKVIINASDTVYIAHDVLDLIKEFKKIRAKEENIKVKLVGFKKVYELEKKELLCFFVDGVTFNYFIKLVKLLVK